MHFAHWEVQVLLYFTDAGKIMKILNLNSQFSASVLEFTPVSGRVASLRLWFGIWVPNSISEYPPYLESPGKGAGKHTKWGQIVLLGELNIHMRNDSTAWGVTGRKGLPWSEPKWCSFIGLLFRSKLISVHMFWRLRWREGQSCQLIATLWWIGSDGREGCQINPADPNEKWGSAGII